jgi:pilus assembly protein Flp/PilA
VNSNDGVFQMRNFLRSYVRDESGAAAAEYALILAIVGAGIVTAVSLLGTNISTAITNAANKIIVPAA